MGVEDQETTHADGHHEFHRRDGHSQDVDEAPIGTSRMMEGLIHTLWSSSSSSTQYRAPESFMRMQTNIIADEEYCPIQGKRFCCEVEAIEPCPSPENEESNDDASSAVQHDHDDNEDLDTSTPEPSGHTHAEGSSPSGVLFEKDPEPNEPVSAANELRQGVKLIHCFPCSPPVCKGLYSTLDIFKWKSLESLLYRVITTIELPRTRSPGVRSGHWEPKGVGIATSRRSGSGDWCGWAKEGTEGNRGGGNGGRGNSEEENDEGGGSGGRDERKDSFVATATNKDDKPLDRNVALPNWAISSTNMIVTGGSQGRTPSPKKPFEYFAASSSSVGSNKGSIFIGGGEGEGNRREEGRGGRGRGRGWGEEAGGGSRGGERGDGRGRGRGGGRGGEEEQEGKGGERWEEGDGGEEVDAGEPNEKDENSGEVEAVKVSSDGLSSNGRGIITLDGKTDPKVQEDSDTTDDSLPLKVQPQAIGKKAPEPPPNLHVPPFDTTVLPFSGHAPPADAPIPTVPDPPPNCDPVYCEEDLPLFSMLVCPDSIAGCDKCFSLHGSDPSSTLVTGSIEESYRNTVPGISFSPFAEIDGMQKEELDPVFLPWQVCVALKQCTMPVILTTEMEILEKALPLKFFLEICILADDGEHVLALFSSLIDCRSILRHHNIPFAVVPSSVFVDLRHMSVMMPRSFCIMEQTWEEFKFFALEVLDILEPFLKQTPHYYESLNSDVHQMLDDGEQLQIPKPA